MILIVDDDHEMAACIAHAIKKHHHDAAIANNAITAMDIINAELPELIFLDILLTGPDGFTLLNELISYPDTSKIPIVIITSLDIKNANLSAYGIVGILHKDTMTPTDIKNYIQEYTKSPQDTQPQNPPKSTPNPTIYNIYTTGASHAA